MRRRTLWWSLSLALLAGCGAPAEAPAPERSEPVLPSRRVSVPALELLLAGPQSPVVIDTRPRAAYDAFHIPGAIPLGVHELAHAAAAKVGDPVVVGAGVTDTRLCQALAALARQGRELRMLEGGMAAWCAAGARSTGACHDPTSAPLTISARALTLVSRGERPFVAPKEDCGCL